MRKAVRATLDFIVQQPVFLYGMAALLSGIVVWFLPNDLLQAFIHNSLPAIPGVTFSLFGFAITAISILVSLKGSPSFEMLQRVNFRLWKSLIGAFIQEACVYAAFGLMTLLINADQIAALKGHLLQAIVFLYCFLFLATILATVCAVYLLRLIANSPIVEPTQPGSIDISSLQNFQDPTSLLPPRSF